MLKRAKSREHRAKSEEKLTAEIAKKAQSSHKNNGIEGIEGIIERWNNEKMEKWNSGILEKWKDGKMGLIIKQISYG